MLMFSMDVPKLWCSGRFVKNGESSEDSFYGWSIDCGLSNALTYVRYHCVTFLSGLEEYRQGERHGNSGYNS